MTYALGGLAVYTVVTHVVLLASIGGLKSRIGRLERIFRSMGVRFEEDKEEAAPAVEEQEQIA